MSLRFRGTPEIVVYLRVCLTVGRRPQHVPLPVRDMNPHVCPSGGGGTFLGVAVRGLAVPRIPVFPLTLMQGRRLIVLMMAF